MGACARKMRAIKMPVKYYIAHIISGFEKSHVASEIRNNFDPKAALIPPHLTLLFPLAYNKEKEFLDEVYKVTQATRSFTCTLDEIFLKLKENRADLRSIFWIPGEGKREIEQLHKMLYEGVFRVEKI